MGRKPTAPRRKSLTLLAAFLRSVSTIVAWSHYHLWYAVIDQTNITTYSTTSEGHGCTHLDDYNSIKQYPIDRVKRLELNSEYALRDTAAREIETRRVERPGSECAN